MGLDTSTSSSLWKDRALVEVNLAVLHSFQVGYLNKLLYVDFFSRNVRVFVTVSCSST